MFLYFCHHCFYDDKNITVIYEDRTIKMAEVAENLYAIINNNEVQKPYEHFNPHTQETTTGRL